MDEELEKLVGSDKSVENLTEDYIQALESWDKALKLMNQAFTVMNQANSTLIEVTNQANSSCVDAFVPYARLIDEKAAINRKINKQAGIEIITVWEMIQVSLPDRDICPKQVNQLPSLTLTTSLLLHRKSRLLLMNRS